MATRSSVARPINRHTAGLVVGCALAAILQAATPEPVLDELDEVLVIGQAPLPIKDYVELPQFDSVVISPGGTHLAMRWTENNRLPRLRVVDLRSKKPLSGGLREPWGYGVTDLRWMGENRLMMQLDWPLLDFRRSREPLGTLLFADLDGRVLQELSPVPNPLEIGAIDRLNVERSMVDKALAIRTSDFDPLLELLFLEQIATQTGAGKGPLAFGPVRPVNGSASDLGQLLFQTVWTGEADKLGYGVFEQDLAGCKQVRVASLPLRGGEVITGPDHRPALVAGVNEVGERVVYFLPEAVRAKGIDWQLAVRSPSGERGLLPLAWTGQDEQFYALDGRDLPTRAVVVWNAHDNTRQVLYQHVDADIDVASFDPAGKPWMFSGFSKYPVYWYPDPAHPLAQLHSALVRRLPREQVDIMNATDNLATAVIRISSGARPTMFFVVDVKTGKSITGMYMYPKLQGKRIAPVEAIEFKARDGLDVRGYLTTPLNQKGEPRRGLPLLVIAHDGPSGEFPDYRYTADSRYDFERQLFASRGYAVLQVNVRGSAGRGAAFQRAGDGEWGGAVQDDYADAVRWAIKQGAAAAGRVCFYGTGYGAYSALMAAAREPDLFQCVIGVEGVYDLPRLVQARNEVKEMTAGVWVPREPECKNMAQEMEGNVARVRSSSSKQLRKAGETLNGKEGEPRGISPLLQRAIGNDLEQLRVRSPVSHASTIKAKVLLVRPYRGKKNEDQLDAMRSALKSAGSPAQTYVIGDVKNAGNYLNLQMHSDAYKELLGFLDKQVGN